MRTYQVSIKRNDGLDGRVINVKATSLKKAQTGVIEHELLHLSEGAKAVFFESGAWVCSVTKDANCRTVGMTGYRFDYGDNGLGAS